MSWQRVPLFGSRMDASFFGRVVERDGGREQGIEARVGEHCDRGGEPARVRPARPMRRRDLSDLAGDQPQPAAVERAAERKPPPPCRRTSSVRPPSPLRPRARARWQVRPRFRWCETRMSQSPAPLPASQSGHRACRASSAARRVDVDERHIGAGNRAAQKRNQRADHPAPTIGDPVRRARRRHPRPR